jgi:2-succinyl-6-hydroxy-2,4-cyclohexadiene-1-carboxylate synthase
MPLFGAPGERIGYELYPHPESAPPLVLLHGFTASKASFEANLAGFQEHFTVITVELLGHGDSDAPDDPILYRPERAIRRILQLLDHLGYQRVLLCGHSLGGALALRLALDAPEWVAGLIVINSSSAAGNPAWREASRPRMQEMADRLRAEGSTEFMKSTRLYPAHSKRLDPLSRELLTRDFDRLKPEGLAGTAESLVIDVNVWERHPVLSVPMLLVVGEKDADFAPNAAGFMERFPPDLTRTVRLPLAGHAANIEQPREFEAAVVQFARDIAYLPLAAPRGEEGNHKLTALGGALVVAGLGLLAAAVIFTGGNDKKDNTLLAAEPETTSVAPGAVASVAGTRITGPAQAVTPGPNVTVSTLATSPTVATVAATPTTAPATATPAPPTPTTRPAATTAPTDTPEPTATPTSAPTATATPSGPRAAISGPSTASVGETVVLYDASSPQPITRTWTYPGGSSKEAGVSFTPATPACYTVSMTAYFPSGVLTTAKSIAVGGVACGN